MGNKTQQIWLKTEIWWKRYKPPKLQPSQCSVVNSNWTCELWMAFKNSLHLRYIWKIYHKNLTSMRNFSNKFYWIWTPDAKVRALWSWLTLCEDTFCPLRLWRVKHKHKQGIRETILGRYQHLNRLSKSFWAWLVGNQERIPNSLRMLLGDTIWLSNSSSFKELKTNVSKVTLGL